MPRQKKTPPTDRPVFKLHDETIVQVVKLLQMAMLTGTNVVDHFRLMRLEVKPGSQALELTPEYQAWFENQIEKMLKFAEEEAAKEQQKSVILQ